MKLHASLELTTPEASEGLIRAFFEKFDKSNVLAISENIATVEFHFEDKPPMEIVYAVSRCKIKSLHFEHSTAKLSETTPVVKTSSQAEEVAQEEELPTQTVETTTEQEEVPAQSIEISPAEEVTSQIEETAPVEESPTQVKDNKSSTDVSSELSKIAENSASFEGFVASVATLFAFNKRSQFFADLIEAATKASKVAWNEIEANLKVKSKSYNYDKTCCNRKVTEKFEGYTLLSLIKLVVQYQDFAFMQKTPEPAITEEQTSVASNKIPCMPEIPALEEALLTVDKTWPVESRVKHVLFAMGLEMTGEKEQEEILALANTAVTLPNISFGKIVTKSNIPTKDVPHARTAFSSFVNNFLTRNGFNQKVKWLDFLKDLQTNIMFADEIKP